MDENEKDDFFQNFRDKGLDFSNSEASQKEIGNLENLNPNGQKSLKPSKRSAESKKLVFLSRKVLEEVIKHRQTTGTRIA